MAELLLELYSEEIPPQLQIGARNQLKQFFERSFEEENINYKELDGCNNPNECSCTFRHKNCKLFLIRKCIINNLTGQIEYFSPGCNGIKKINNSNQMNYSYMISYNKNHQPF